MKINEIQNLIRFVAKSGVSEVELELKDFKISIRNLPPPQVIQIAQTPVFAVSPQSTPVIQTPATLQDEDHIEKKPEESSIESNYITIKSPMIGTFYRTAGPDKPPFVNAGDVVKKGQNLCIIEAMKLFNEIESDVAGKVVKILIDDSSPVEYDSPLFLIDPA